jgi:hypothetical protein
MVPRLLVLALVAVAGGIAAALLADEPAGPASRAIVRAVSPPVEAPTSTAEPAPAEAPTPTAKAEPQHVASTASVPSVRRARRPARPPVRRPVPLRVPALVGFPEDVAVAAVRRLRLRPIVRRLPVSNRNSHGIVTRQFPAAGLRVPSGTPVTIIVAVYTGR